MDGNADRWRRIKEKFLEATELDPDQRAAWLEQLRVEDPDLGSEVSSLLSAHLRPNAVLDGVAADYLSPGSFTQADERWIGRRIGSYVVVDLLGRGGMGEVYRARRADAQYHKEVAIKLVRAGYDTRYVLDRFRAERQILADLEHPNIARLLDGGATDEGLPYLVMELVEGEPIDAYCDRQRLSVRDRLSLFRRVCEAVQFAHQRLVIHRDLKTSNILVTQNGIPKLLDFGVAKLLKAQGAAADNTLLTPLTPAYASPEQLRGEPLTTASDVYSLGVVLYEMLTGHSPFRGRTGTPTASASAIGADPRRPSAALQPARLEQVSALRGTTANRLRRQLAGDVDAIVMMALRSEPRRRYASVQQLGEDIDRHLQGAAVAAHRGSWRYRAGKFVGRNKIAVAAAAVTVSALAAGLIATTYQAQVARVARQRADARFDDVRKLANALIFDVNNAMADTPGNTTARKLLLDRAVIYLDKLSQDAAGDSNLQRELAWGYQKLAAVQGNTTESNVGEISAADISLHKAIGLFEAVYRANPGSVEDGLNLAMSHRLMGSSDVYYEKGWPEVERAVAITDELASMHTGNEKIELERCRAYDLLGYAQDLRGDRLLAVASVRKALTIARALQQQKPDSAVARLTVHLGDQLSRGGFLKEAESTLQEGVRQYAVLRQRSDALELTRNAAHAQMLLGRVNMLRGHIADAEANFGDAGATSARLLRLDPGNSMLTWDVISLSFERGRMLAVSGRATTMPPDFRPVVDQYARHLEDDSGPGIGLLQAWLAQVHYRSGHYAQALQALRESITGLQAEPLYADARSGLAADQVMIGDAQLKLRDFAAARAAYDKALASIDVRQAVARGDVPALYALADAQAGMGDLLSAQAAELTDTAQHSQYRARACAYYADSAHTWSNVAEPASYSPDQFPSGNPQSVQTRLAACPPLPAVADR
jgi:tRNA A-37 threonylcarbamoyl transferase component Bud32/tetratricopeptide (TPR) repeat protein